MKISKRQLRRIIKEEKQKLLKENPGVGRQYTGGVPAAGDLEPLVDELLSILRSMDPMDRNPEIYNIIDELESLAER